MWLWFGWPSGCGELWVSSPPIEVVCEKNLLEKSSCSSLEREEEEIIKSVDQHKEIWSR